MINGETTSYDELLKLIIKVLGLISSSLMHPVDEITIKNIKDFTDNMKNQFIEALRDNQNENN